MVFKIDQSKDFIVNVVATPVDDGGDAGASDKDWIINHALQVSYTFGYLAPSTIQSVIK